MRVCVTLCCPEERARTPLLYTVQWLGDGCGMSVINDLVTRVLHVAGVQPLDDEVRRQPSLETVGFFFNSLATAMTLLNVVSVSHL